MTFELYSLALILLDVAQALIIRVLRSSAVAVFATAKYSFLSKTTVFSVQ